MTQPWPTPSVTEPVRATVPVPGSKSITNRALLLAALADSPAESGSASTSSTSSLDPANTSAVPPLDPASRSSTIYLPLRSRDTQLMAAALRSLGIRIADGNQGSWDVTPGPLRGGADLDCGLAGTVMRFVPPAAALADGDVRFDGDEQARVRPMNTVLDALRALGVASSTATRCRSRCTAAARCAAAMVTMDASASSQFVSALLLAGARYEQGVTVLHDGKPVPSLPHIEMTIEMLRAVGVEVDDSEPNRWRVAPGRSGRRTGASSRTCPTRPPSWPARPSRAARSPCRTGHWSPRSPATRCGTSWTRMGAGCRLSDNGLTVTGTGGLDGIEVDLHEASELTPIVAAMAALADSPTRIRGVAHIRGHETDRLAALTTELGPSAATPPRPRTG